MYITHQESSGQCWDSKNSCIVLSVSTPILPWLASHLAFNVSASSAKQDVNHGRMGSITAKIPWLFITPAPPRWLLVDLHIVQVLECFLYRRRDTPQTLGLPTKSHFGQTLSPVCLRLEQQATSQATGQLMSFFLLVTNSLT